MTPHVKPSSPCATTFAEKVAPENIPAASVQQPRRQWRKVVRILIAALGAYLLWPRSDAWLNIDTLPDSLSRTAQGHGSGDWDFLEIPASESLEWQPCWDEQYHCARLSLPMNWGNTSDPARVQIALVKLPARVPITDRRYAGAILMNPGGPGVSGVAQVSSGGRHVQTIVDGSLMYPAESRKFYDIIGFDTRGVNNTTPHLTCFPDKKAEKEWKDRAPSGRLLGARKMNLDEEWAMRQALGHSCAQERDGKGPNVVRFVNSAQVVEDMVAIIERHGEWREKEARRLLASITTRESAQDAAKIMEAVKWRRDAEVLNYWGFSYGTLLGQTFMAKYPERVGRIVLDGLSRADELYGQDDLTSLEDTDQIVHRWGEYCDQAGERCPFFNPQARMPGYFWAVLASTVNFFIEHPVPMVTARGPQVFSYDHAMDLLGFGLFEPQNLAEIVIQVLSEVPRGNLTTLARLATSHTSTRSYDEECARDGPYSTACVRDQSITWISDAVSCSDGEDIRDQTKDDFLEHLAKLERQSDTMGSYRSRTRRACINWPSRPAWKPEVKISGLTKNTVLMIGNRLDTVTPLSSARNAASADVFPNSRVLEVDIEGHCSISNPSICVGKAVREYFQSGMLPVVGMVCQPEFRPWLGCVSKDGCEGRDVEEEELFGALNGLTRAWSISGLRLEEPKPVDETILQVLERVQ